MHRPSLILSVLLAACGASANGDDQAGDDSGSTVDSRSPDATPSCPQGTTAGTMNGIAVCKTAAGIPLLDHVFVILMENTSRDTLVNSTNTPYIHSLIDGGAFANDYHGVEHPSLPNYIALASGMIDDNGPLDCDCLPTGDVCDTSTFGNCSFLSHNCGCPQSHQHLGDQLDAAGVSWRAYAESMGTACNLTGNGDFEPKHVPFLYFPTLTDDATRCDDRVVDYDSFAGDLSAARRFAFITPNMTHDMHDPVPAGNNNYANGDTWLAAQVPAILASSAFQDHGMLVIVWDEDDLSGVINPDDPIPMIILSPLAKQGYSSTVTANHYSLLATIEDALGLDRLGSASSATPLGDFFPSN